MGNYLLAYFIGNGVDGLRWAWSRDGMRWKETKKGWGSLVPAVGDEIMRDPFVIQGQDGRFHAVWTVGWSGRGLGYAWSEDLLSWSGQKYVPVMEHEPKTVNTWAPEIVFDPEAGEFIVFWSSTIPGRFPQTDYQGRTGLWGEGLNNRIYACNTKDFERFSATRLFYDPGINVIDACIRPDGEGFVMFIKDETNLPWRPQKNIRIVRARSASGPWVKMSEPITGEFWAEGPSGIKVGDKWHVYYDRYREHRYGVSVSADLEKWEDLTDELAMPEPGPKHATALEVSDEIFNGLV